MTDDEFYFDPRFCHAWDVCATERGVYDNIYDSILSQDQDKLQRILDITREFGQEGVEGESRGYADDATWILTASFVIFTMQSGFGLLEAGSCSMGYEVNIMMKNIIDVAFGSLAYYLVGYGISFGQPSIPFMGLGDMPADGGYDEVSSGLLYSRYIFQLSFAATSTTIVSGCVAERLRFFIYVVYSFFSVVFYAFCAHWVFDTGGWLNLKGVHDFAGGGPVHLFGGINGLIGVLFLGPRKGRFDGTRPISDFFPTSPTSQCIGLFMLWWGWIGFNCGSTFGITDDRWVVAIRTSVTTINSTVGGVVFSILYSLWRTNWTLVIPEHVVNGILGSLVSITPSCACVRTYVAFPIGAIGAFLALGSNTIICRLKLDDPVGGIGHHGVAGIWGLISVGLFAESRLPGIDVKDGLFNGGGFELLGLQLLEIVAITAWSILWATSFFYVTGVFLSGDYKNPRKGLRVCAEEEERGADWFMHGVVDMEALMTEMETSMSKLPGTHKADPALCRSSNSSIRPTLAQSKKPTLARKPSYTRRSDMYNRSGLENMSRSQKNLLWREGVKMMKSNLNVAMASQNKTSMRNLLAMMNDSEEEDESGVASSTLPTVSEMTDDDNQVDPRVNTFTSCREQQEDRFTPNAEEGADDLAQAIEEISHAIELEDPPASNLDIFMNSSGDVAIDNGNEEGTRNGVTRQKSGILGRLTGGLGGSGRRLANNDRRAAMLERQASVRKLQVYR